MWLRQSLFTAVNEDGTAIFLDVDDFGQHWLMIQRKGDTPKPLQKCHCYDAEKTFNDLIESQNAPQKESFILCKAQQLGDIDMTKAELIKKLDQLDTDLNSFYEDLNISCDLYSAVDEFHRALCDLIHQLEKENHNDRQAKISTQTD